MKLLDKILTSLIIFLAIGILATVAVFSMKKSALDQQTIPDHAEFIPAQNLRNQKQNTFTKIGQIRAATKEGKNAKSSIVIITPYLEYEGGNQSFYEELDRNTKKIKEMIIRYFSTQTTAQLNQKGESKIKSDLLEQINEILVLQKIKNIYFVDYQIL